MYWHFVALAVVTIIGVIANMLSWIKVHIESEDTRYQIGIAETILQIITLPLWETVQALIIYVIVMYGKPLEADAKKLLSNKLA